MSEQTARTTDEERFLGVKTTIEPPENVESDADSDNLQIEVVDDRPVEDQREPTSTKSDDDGMANDEEIQQVGQESKNA